MRLNIQNHLVHIFVVTAFTSLRNIYTYTHTHIGTYDTGIEIRFF